MGEKKLHLLLIVVEALLQAFVLQWMWLWFITPLGIPFLSYAQALGLCAGLELFVWPPKEPHDMGFFIQKLATNVLVLVIGAFVAPFVPK